MQAGVLAAEIGAEDGLTTLPPALRGQLVDNHNVPWVLCRRASRSLRKGPELLDRQILPVGDHDHRDRTSPHFASARPIMAAR